ncbi:uncharacterized protein LOC130723632 isoform X2 [Lotus japonicus]|uniref:uncharacterized protein LOC130723632 isoform X2 n=1 Tax=Lotus japonicus TaxID=34305 RepID=UPI00258BF597|nr:uncharacterized protein LOC130723632 isoform X2 [Lotus japonicus]
MWMMAHVVTIASCPTVISSRFLLLSTQFRHQQPFPLPSVILLYFSFFYFSTHVVTQLRHPNSSCCRVGASKLACVAIRRYLQATKTSWTFFFTALCSGRDTWTIKLRVLGAWDMCPVTEPSKLYAMSLVLLDAELNLRPLVLWDLASDWFFGSSPYVSPKF